MADQFCRIVNTTLTDSTLGSDASQSILTTDANTSYVIRDMFQKNSCDNASLTMTGSLVMDGVTIASGVTSGASGSLVIPPSSNVCYVETSVNYPLKYQDIYIYPDVRAECNSNCKLVVCECQVNGLASGSVVMNPINLTSYWGTVNICNFCQGGFWAQAPETCNIIMYCSDGNSTQTLRIFCCSGTAGCLCCSMNYCEGDYKDGIFMHVSGASTISCIRAYFPGCYQACCTAKCCMTINFAHCGPTTYSFFGLSDRINDDFHCRLVAYWPGASCHCKMLVYYVDMTNCDHTLVYCNAPSSVSDCFCNGVYTDNQKAHPFVLDGVPHLALTKFTSYLDIAKFEGGITDRSVKRYSLPSAFDGCTYNISNDRIWNTSTCLTGTPCIISAKISDIMSDETNAPITVHAACDVAGCYTGSHAGQTKVYYQTLTSVTPSDFDINPSTKLAIYGIKST